MARCVHRVDHVEARHHRAQVVVGAEGVVVVEEAWQWPGLGLACGSGLVRVRAGVEAGLALGSQGWA